MTVVKRTRGKLVVGMTAMLGMSCQGGTQPSVEPTGSEQSATQALTSAEIDRVLGFESLSDWQIANGIQGVLTSSTTHSQGSRSLGVSGANYLPIKSIALSSLGTRVQQHLQYDLQLPPTAPTQGYAGTTQIYLDCPSRNMYSTFVGQVALNYFPTSQWATVDMTLSSTITNALGGTYSDLRITVVLNLPSTVTGTYLIDNLRFSSTAALAGACDAGGYRPKAAGTVCRPASGVCDAAETCTGTSLGCPVDTFSPAGTVCRPAAGVCDAAETCTGNSAACPADAFLGNTVVCRPAADVCDVAESCTGTSVVCPADGFAPATQVCRPSTQSCDLIEMCTGTGAACPPDAHVPPPAPTGLTATAGSGRVQLAWTSYAGATAYNVKRGMSSSGPFDLVASATTSSFADELRAIGPTTYYVVTTLSSCGESNPSAVVSAAPFSSKTGTFTPGPKGLKMDPALVVVPTPADVIARYGSAAMRDPSAISGTVGTGQKVRKVMHALSSNPYARVRYELKKVGTGAVIQPRFAAQLDGPLVLSSTISGEILAVGRSSGVVNFVSTVKDPRKKTSLEAPGMPTGVKALKEDGGWILVDLPEMFVSSDTLVAGTTFEFYALSGSVPVTTPVSVATLPTLMAGSTLIATSSGSSLLPILFPGH
jgi:hypothetical protein